MAIIKKKKVGKKAVPKAEAGAPRHKRSRSTTKKSKKS